MSKTILIIEDDPYVQRYFERLFAHHNYTFEIVGSGEKGIDRANALIPALILLDVMMPVVDGLQTLAMLKSSRMTRDIMVVILTNYGEETIRSKMKQLGARDFIIKSDTPPEDLTKRIDMYLAEVDNK